MTDRYVIGECPRCHTPIIADSRYKNKTCPRCYGRIPILDLKVLHTARDSREARTILSKLKAVRGGLDQT
jgi:hypothetical protein